MEGKLGHQHPNDGWGAFDDDNVVGTNFFVQTLELALTLQDVGYGENGKLLGLRPVPVRGRSDRGSEARHPAMGVHLRFGRPHRPRSAARSEELKPTPWPDSGHSTKFSAWTRDTSQEVIDRRREAKVQGVVTGDTEVSVFLGLDVGTGGARALAVDERGRVLAEASSEYPLA